MEEPKYETRLIDLEVSFMVINGEFLHNFFFTKKSISTMKLIDSEIGDAFRNVNEILVENFFEAILFSWAYLIACDVELFYLSYYYYYCC